MTLQRQQDDILHKLNLLCQSKHIELNTRAPEESQQSEIVVPIMKSQRGMVDPSQDMVIFSLFNKTQANPEDDDSDFN